MTSMRCEINTIKDFVSVYKNTILLPLAQEGFLDAELAKDAQKMYIDQMFQVEKEKPTKIIEREGDLALIHPYHIAGFNCKDEEWKSIEHYFQASRFFGSDDKFAKYINSAKSAQVAHRRGINGCKSHKLVRSDWNEVYEKELEHAYENLFKQHPECLEVLLNTGTYNLKISPHSEEVDNCIGNVLCKLRAKYSE